MAICSYSGSWIYHHIRLYHRVVAYHHIVADGSEISYLYIVPYLGIWMYVV